MQVLRPIPTEPPLRRGSDRVSWFRCQMALRLGNENASEATGLSLESVGLDMIYLDLADHQSLRLLLPAPGSLVSRSSV